VEKPPLSNNKNNKDNVFFTDERKKISFRFLKGKGIEIGALHDPLPVKDNAHVTYVDYLSLEDLKKRYQELDTSKFVKVDLIDNGEVLSTIADNSLDFIIANHFLEHCENPIGTIKNQLKKIKPGGYLYYAIPDKNLTFDKIRPLTNFVHIVNDHIHGSSISRREHFYEWVSLLENHEGMTAINDRVNVLMETNYSIHFHVWDIETIFQFLLQANEYLIYPFRVVHFEQYGIEIIAVLQKK
jgi:SAM-dependent methyltransferase